MSGIKQYTTCMCPHCKSSFAVEVTFGGIDIKTFSQDQKAKQGEKIVTEIN